MTRSMIAQRSATMLTVVLGLLATRAQAQWRYYYFKDPQPLVLDTERMAIQQSPQAAKGLASEGLPEFGIPATSIEPHTLKGWSYAHVPVAMKADAQIRNLAGQIAAADGVDFVSPVFENESGQTLIITRHVHVGFREDLEPAEAERILHQFGAGRILQRDWSRMKGVYRLESRSRDGFEVLDIANALAQHPDVRFAEPDLIARVRKTFIPNDPMFGSLWGLHNTGQSGGTVDMDMDGPEAWDITTGDPSVLVVVMDTGIQLDHVDLNIGAGEDFTGQDGGGWPVNECDNHGTMVAGCVSAIINNAQGVVGIAPNCRVASARVFISDVPCSIYGTVSSSWVVDALDWAYSIGARITTASIGMPSSSTLTNKFATTREMGITHFTSSGNNGGGSIGYPGNVDAVNAIGAIDRDGNRASFSQYGPDLAFSAPGQSILTTARGNGYGWADGTSFASQYAAGVAALLVSLEPILWPDLVEQILQETCTDRGDTGWDEQFGWGIVNAHQGLQWLQAPADPCTLGKLTAADAAPDSQFGWAVAMDHDVLVVGAPRDDELATDAGAAYVYRRSGTSWTYETKLTASDATLEDRFGWSVAVNGNVIAVGAYQNDAVAPDSGAVYVFNYDGMDWGQTQKLTASDGANSDRFGYSVSVDEDVLVTGAYGDDDAGSMSGSAYVFRHGASWVEEQKLTAAGAASADFFGWTVSVSGDYVLVGAPLTDVVGLNSGAVYVHRYDGQDWDDQTKITPSDAADGDNFGYSVSIDGERFVAGAQLVDSHVPNSGAVYVYRLDGADWLKEQKIRASDGGEEDRLGYVVSLSGEVLVAGAYRNDEAGADTGAAYVYAHNGFRGYWGLEEKLIASDGTDGDEFGRSVATKRGFALVGAPYDADAGPDTGAAYLYAGGTDCNRNRTPDICDIRDGFSEDFDDDGVPDDCCPIAPIPSEIPDVTKTNRYISFMPGEGTQPTAFRVTLVNVPGFTSFNGEHRWVDSPRQITEASGSSDPEPPPTFWGANLRCDPAYRDWSAVDVLHLFDEAILPGGTYAVQAIAEGCDTATEDWYTAAVTMVTTPLWGDVVGDCGVRPCTGPNGVVDFIDISAVVEKFKNDPDAVLKARADVDPDQPNAVIDFTDISYVVEGFRGSGYPFGGPQPCPP